MFFTHRVSEIVVPYIINDSGLNEKDWPWLQDHSTVSLQYKKNKIMLLQFIVYFEKLKKMNPELTSFEVSIANNNTYIHAFTVSHSKTISVAIESNTLTSKHNFVELEISTNAFFIPKEIEDSPDTRKLSCVLKKISYL